MLAFTHDLWMVAAAFAIALFAGFSGMSLLRGASRLDVGRRKFLVAVAAFVLGGGIWSMHFVAMLGLQLPVAFYYDGLTTLVSVLVAILMVGLALLVLHFPRRTPVTMTIAGVILGAGIAAMHYVGMSGMEICGPVFRPMGVVVALVASLLLSNLAIWVGYGARTRGNILLGTLCFAVAVVSMHFIAMLGTDFYLDDVAVTTGPALSNATLAMMVAVSSFVISGVSLLSGVSFFVPLPQEQEIALPEMPLVVDTPEAPAAAPVASVRVPYDREGRTQYAESADIAAIRAEGHYTVVYRGPDKIFCSWSISDADRRLEPLGFLRVHRSWLVNPAFVADFQRTKDTGFCLFRDTESLTKVPVARSRLQEVRELLGM
ncbi:carbon monoxide dehydrogenase [Donghicola sp. C2-DW-16]|uniref:Carbon monoxide dehydrogenase n=1 Tax=Donghicola mangrovi TaxID=2729614 RepID=A0ABX2PD04_9RHOB|nr:MHYT domain-containing protein [Donghicola mangrovi]NVO27345.1 carbon monoxide dehydrogenase [Donghicola mangrovi]